MRRVAIIVLMTFAAAAHAVDPAARTPRLSVQAEYRRDAIDYDTVEKQFFREKISLFFIDRNSLNLCHLFMGAKREHRFTGNIHLPDISPYFEGIVGNFHVNYGYGLVAGKKKAVSPDPFSRGMILSRTSAFSPANSGNPLFCYLGIASIVHFKFPDVTVSLGGFFSTRKRYGKNELAYLNATDNSLNSIIGRIQRDISHTEPVDVFDYGSVLEIRPGDHFFLQTYFLYTFVRRVNKQSILWNYDDRNGFAAADRAFFCYGFFARYQDDYLTVFLELGIPNRVLRYPGKGQGLRSGYGLLCGLRFSHPAITISIRGKTTGRTFFSPCSSDQGAAERTLSAALSTRITAAMTLGGSIFLEKKLSPSFSERMLNSVIRERLYARCRLPRGGVIGLVMNFMTTETSNGRGHYIQLKPTVQYRIAGSIIVSFTGTVQKKGPGRVAYSLQPRLALTFFNFATMTLRYHRLTATRDNILYAPLSSARNSIAPSSGFDSTTNILSAQLSLRYRGFMLSLQYQYLMGKGRPSQHRAEVQGRCLL